MKYGLILAALLAASCSRKSEPPAAPAAAARPPGTWVKARRAPLAQTEPATGTLRARQVTRLGSQVSGRVEAVLVDVGAAVKKGQELVRLEKTLFEMEAGQRKADLEAAEVALADAELNHNRMKNLWEKPDAEAPSVPKKLYDDAKTRRDAAGARVKQAQEGLRWAEQRLRETVILAPYDGAITQRFVDAGEPATSMPVTQLLEIQDASTLELDFSLPQALLPGVSAQTRIEFEVEGIEKPPAAARIEMIFPALDEATRTFRCRVVVDNAEGIYRPGLLVRVRAVLGEAPNALVLPRRALTRSKEGWQVSVLSSGRPEARPVRIGLTTDDLAQILEGVKEGEEALVP